MNDLSWDNLEQWALSSAPEDIPYLKSALDKGPKVFLETLKEICTPASVGLRPTLLAITFWRLHGVPAASNLHHGQLILELAAHLPANDADLVSFFSPEDIIFAKTFASMKLSARNLHQKVTEMSDYLVCAGHIEKMHPEPYQLEEAVALHWLCSNSLAKEGGTFNVSPGRYERFGHLLGGRNRVWISNGPPVKANLHPTEVLFDDEVHLVGDTYTSLHIPPASLR